MSTNRPNTPVQPAHLYHDVQTAKFIKDTAYLANTCGRSDHLRHHQDVKPVYAKLSMQAMLTFASMNVKKITNWTWQGPKLS
ncbi:hypothetical protein [Bacillus sp. mrc49]|uniref:hypothetical protein n=1 Tax=Bacillus sp. mrc49 TaxID=2054913 RepID=UPI000C26DF24|nr:hypothetical protein [Bacillus sp. mrc49]PJN88915.1 hypothetical protein CVN76_18370 [Bacillus sp. mrc49]